MQDQRQARVTLFVLIASAMFASADPSSSSFYLGDLAGFNLSGMFISDLEESGQRMVVEWGGNLGAIVGYRPWRFLDIENGVLLLSKGYGAKKDIVDNGTPFTLHHEYRYGFCEFPLILKPTVRMPSQALFYGLLGISYARLFLAKYTMDVVYDEGNNYQRENVLEGDMLQEGFKLPTDTVGGYIEVPYDYFRRMYDASLILGLGFEAGRAGIPKARTMVVEIKYFIGLVDNSYISSEGKKKIAEAADKFRRYVQDSSVDYYINYPVERFQSLTFSIGFRHYL